MNANGKKAAERIFESVLAKIKPSEEELRKTTENINEITAALRKIVPKEVEIRVVGSVVRGTQLRGESDIDVFLLFGRRLKRDYITKKGLEYAKKIISDKRDRYEIRYAEHPYTKLYLNSMGVEADIVPAFNIDKIEEMATAVDRSPMHAEFMIKHLSDRQRDDVRLLKYLLLQHGIYGAEVATGGFSGYLCELLVHHFGSLIDTLEAVSNIKVPIALAPAKREAISDKKITERFHSDFVVIDPVDTDRNVAAAVSKESLSKFTVIAREFVKEPSMKLFENKKRASGYQQSLEKFLTDSGLDAFLICMKVPDKSEDTIWPQLRKVSWLIKDYAERFGFEIWYLIPSVKGNVGMIFMLAPKKTLKSRLAKGPSVLLKEAQVEFLEKHKNALGVTFFDDKIYALEKNKYSKLEEVLRYVVTGKLKKRHKDISMSGAKLFVGHVPAEYAQLVYSGLLQKISI